MTEHENDDKPLTDEEIAAINEIEDDDSPLEGEDSDAD